LIDFQDKQILKTMNNNSVFIIAEAGVNHNGSIETAKKIIDVASCSGADAVKFQTFVAERLVSRNAPKADYQKKTTSVSESQFDMIKKLELNELMHHQLIEYCAQKQILFISSPFDLDSIDFLHSLGLKIFKIPSGEITNLPYLRKIGQLKKKIILSSGMSYLSEIEAALSILNSAGTGKKDITLLHCNTEYPTPFEDVNLNAIKTIRKAFPEIQVGYSDHTSGYEVSIAAVAMGAKVIEKHLTLDRTMEGPDHKSSLEPKEFKNMVDSIRNIEKALGSGEKEPSASERRNINIVRKSIVAAKQICKGDIFSEENITVKRPGTGLSPMMWDDVIGKKATRDYSDDEMIE
jgi:N,N'-diacetyllegionaminate synthase